MVHPSWPSPDGGRSASRRIAPLQYRLVVHQPGPVLGADQIVSILRRFGALLAMAEDHLNETNVFPLADRDTGTNLLRTVSHLVDELDSGGPGTIGERAALASLAAARGNRGLIVSQ